MKFKKRNYLSLIPLLFSLLLAGCTPNNDGKVLIPQIKTSAISKENYTIPITKERFLAFKEGKRSFILLVSSERCPFCQQVEPLLVNYVKEYKVEMYKLEGTSKEARDNLAFYREELEPSRTDLPTPTIYIFANGEIIKREIGIAKLKTRKEVITFFDEYIKTLSYYSLETDEEVEGAKNEIYFKFDFDSEFSQSIVNNHFYPLFSKKTNVYLIDEEARLELEISFTDYQEKFMLSEENNDLSPALAFFTTNFS